MPGLNGQRWQVQQGDCIEWLNSLPPDSVDFLMGSPPYESARLYLEDGKDLKIARDTEAWVAWMVEATKAALRVCKGLVVWVVEGQTKNYRYSCSPMLLMADLCRQGITLRKPPIYSRVGIPGSGGPDWLRNDYEPIICATRGGKLPWSDNLATGEAPKYGPGGRMTNRTKNGKRVYERNFKDLGKNGHVRQGYTLPDVANPGNIIHCAVGGGKMGNNAAHDNEAPYPEKLCEFFIRSFCPEDGVVADCFSGSGTTGAVALKWGRRYLGCDLRQSMVDLSIKRLKGETTLFDQPVEATSDAS